MNISVSSLVRRLERELEAEKLKSAKLEIEVTQLKERLRQLDIKHHEDVSKIMKPNILSAQEHYRTASQINDDADAKAKRAVTAFEKLMSPLGQQFQPPTV